MHQTSAFVLLALALSMFNCTGSIYDKYVGLASPLPEIRDQTRNQLLLSDPERLCSEVKKIVFSKETPDDVSEAALLLLGAKADSLPERLLVVANHMPSPRARAALLSIVDLNVKNTEDVKAVGSMLEDTNLIVRLLAASLLKDQKGYSEAVMAVGLQSLSSDETEWLGDPPRPAVIMGKQLLVSLKDRKTVLAFLRKQTPSVRRAQYHMRDLVAYLSKKNPSLIFNHIGDPTDQEVKLLSAP
jgi:hypothetical protein